jgi:hypothetical protein
MTKFKHIPYLEIDYDGTGLPENGFKGLFVVHNRPGDPTCDSITLVEAQRGPRALAGAYLQDPVRMGQFWLCVYNHYAKLGDELAAKEAMYQILGSNE